MLGIRLTPSRIRKYKNRVEVVNQFRIVDRTIISFFVCVRALFAPWYRVLPEASCGEQPLCLVRGSRRPAGEQGRISHTECKFLRQYSLSVYSP